MRLVFCIVLAMSLSGCVIAIPQGWHVVSGSDHPKEEIAFLDLPGATRDETVASLGSPAWESQNTRVLVYLWQANYTWEVMEQDPLPPTTVETAFRNWALFIAYDEQGHIVAHEKKWVQTADLELNCVLWAYERQQRSAK